MKKYGKKIILVVMIVFCLVAVAQANAFELGARAYVWFPELKKTDIQTVIEGIQGSDINAKDMLGIGNNTTFSVEAYGGMGKNHVSLMFTPFGYSADAWLADNLNYNGKTIVKGADVHSNLGYSMFDLQYQRDLINMENILAGFSVRGIVQVKYSTGSFKLNSSATGFDEKDSFNSVIPMIGIGAHIGLLANLLELRAQATGGGYDSDNYSYETLVTLSLTPLPFFDINASYKLVQLKMDVNNYKMDTLYMGPYLGLTVSF